MEQLQTSGQKPEVYINDIIAHKLLGMDAREQADIDKLGWSKAKLGAQTPLAISTTVCREGAAVKLADKRADKFVGPAFSLNVNNDESRAINHLACQELISVRTGAGSLAEATITVTKVYHTWKFGHQEDARRDACNVGDKTGFLPCASSQRLLSWISILQSRKRRVVS